MLLATRGSGVSVFVAPIVGLLLISAGCMERWEPRTYDVPVDPNPPLGPYGGAGGAGGFSTGAGGSGGDRANIQKGHLVESDEENGSREDVNGQLPIGANALVAGTFSSEMDVDFYKVELGKDSGLSVELFDGEGHCQLLQTKLTLFKDASPSPLLYDEAIKDGDCAATIGFLKEGTYYVMAEQLPNASNVSYPLEYAIEFRFPSEQREDGRVLGSRHMVVSGSINSGSRVDADAFDIKLQAGESIRAEITGADPADCETISSFLSVDVFNQETMGWNSNKAAGSGFKNCPLFRSSDHPGVGLEAGGTFKITVSKLSGKPDFNYNLFVTIRSDDWMTSWSESD
jgi:hypothetical protein